jgi:hypothetical protein
MKQTLKYVIWFFIVCGLVFGIPPLVDRVSKNYFKRTISVHTEFAEIKECITNKLGNIEYIYGVKPIIVTNYTNY